MNPKAILFASVLILLPVSVFAQRTAIWELCDTARMQYVYTTGQTLAASSSHDIVNIGESTEGAFVHIVRRSSDSGSTWQTLLTRDGVGDEVWKSVLHPDSLTYLVTADSTFYLGYDRNGSFAYRYKPFMLVSHDAGVTWSQIDLDSNQSIWDASMFNANYGALLLRHFGNIRDSLPYALPDSIMVTTDAWRTWSVVPAPSKAYAWQMFCFRPNVFGVVGWSKTDSAHCYFKTTDNGTSWTKSTPLPWLNQVQFVTENVGWVALTNWKSKPTRGMLMQTTDGGVTWLTRLDSVLSSTYPSGLGSIVFCDTLHGFAVGQEILQTEDGGKTWTIEYPPYGLSSFWGIQSLTMIAPKLAIATLGGPDVIRYTGRTTLAAPNFHNHDPGPIPISPTTITWTPISGATHYQIQLAVDPPWRGSAQKIFDVISSDATGTDTIYTLNDPIPGETYYGRIRAMNNTDTSDWRQSGEWFQILSLFSTVSRKGLALPPNIISPNSGTVVDRPVRLIWTSVQGATLYSVRISDGLPYQSFTTSDTFYNLTSLQANSNYWVQIRANLPDDSTDWSNACNFATSSNSDVALSTKWLTQLLFPNPAADDLHIQWSSPITPLIFDALGRRQDIPIRYDATGAVLDVHSLPAGTYSIRGLSDQAKSLRFVVQH
jgi:photosystem II stability/assembly factor-like uncharacterized protein